ncbi:hypothetical protein D9615_005408 [Tricholomella constricta]|uniref:F-box domain-containing protein n=1 Tax=Tricholomella constricta TaxID=117010 RepID=A0A8H5HE67_9AGAR|nr:hypothetical protein D9615_005408 [Tricholomella constricta]
MAHLLYLDTLASKKIQRHPATIEDLPAKLLAKIFHVVHSESVAELSRPPTDDPYDKKWFLRPEFVLPRFPDTLIRVSAHWHDIISSIPEFRTNIVFAIDIVKPIPIFEIQSSLDQSFDLPLDILITRCPGSARPTSDEETAVLSPLVALFAPHFHRCRSLSFYGIHSSALPQLGRDLSGTLPSLVTLRLECEIDDGDASPTFAWQSISCPKLDTLTLDGHNFVNMTNMNRSWPLQFPELKSLSIVHLKPSSNEGEMVNGERISLYGFLDVLVDGSLRLEYLRLRDVELTNPYSEEFFVDLSLKKALVLEDLSRSFVYELLFSLKLRSAELHVSRCSLNAMGRLPPTLALRLEEIGEFDNVAGHLKDWQGTSLTFVRCMGFGDDFLDMLAAVGSYSGAAHLSRLTIMDCPNFTVDSLKRMIGSRNKKVEEGDVWPGPPALEELVVTGKGPAVDTADAEWLRSRLKYLHWRVAEVDGDAND